MSDVLKNLGPDRVRLGVTPTLWWNDDFPSIDIGIPFGQCVSEMALAVIHDRETGGIEADKRRIAARNQLLLFANDEVINAYDKWFRVNNTDGHNTDDEVRMFGKLLVAIRRDIQGASKVNEQQIEGLNPFATG